MSALSCPQRALTGTCTRVLDDDASIRRDWSIMRLSARNQIPGTVVEVHLGAVNSTVKVDIGGGNIVTAAITNDAAHELALGEGDLVTVVINSSDVMIGK